MADTRWSIIDAYFAERGLVRQQLDSFNDFITNGLQDTVRATPSVSVTEGIGGENAPDILVGLTSLISRSPLTSTITLRGLM